MKLKILNLKSIVNCCLPRVASAKWGLLLIVLIGGFLRFYNLNWDQGHFFHPDERNIAMAVSRIHFFDQLNPQFFAYGSFPIYLYRVIADLLVNMGKNPAWTFDWASINLIGREVSAFFSTLTIILVFLLGKKIWNEKVGLLASLLTALTVSLIQTAHYGVTESLLVFELLATLLISLSVITQPTLGNYIKVGLILGLALATKISAISFFIIPGMVQIFYHFKSFKHHLKFLILLLVSFLTFILFSPYAFISQQKYLESMNYETGVATGKLKVVYTLQFEKTLPYFFQIKNFFWQMGPAAGLGILGGIILLIIAFRKKYKNLFILLSFPLIYFLYIGSWHTKFIRYMVPILPFLTLFAAWLLVEIKKRWQRLGITLTGLVITITLLWAAAFFSIYTRESTRITASKWIYQNIPQGSKIITEHWDDGLPIPLSTNNPGRFQIEALTIYEPDNQEKITYYAKKLSQSDFIILNSRRLYGTLINLPEKYPVTSRYYKLLFSGQLGYSKIAEFSSYPEILGIKINDDSSEETFQVYDHPKVLIFKNQDQFTQSTLQTILSYDEF